MPSVTLRIAALLCATFLAACSGQAQKPVGRWQGTFEDARLIVMVRLEIDSKGSVRVSAPNAIGEFDGMAEDERNALRARLRSEAAKTWAGVGPMPLDFDGKEFHKPGGVAPQLEWDAEGRHMTMIYYSGNRASVRVPLDPVGSFEAS